ncbi:MAG: hypothetical protein DRP62_04715 [Planctomycetota bacterium]|nr:MAG: hypothetical protein DRP62_04715 [Planctomycetota bacterium]
MKKETLTLTTFFICAALTFSAASVRADAISTSQAWIDWTSLVINGDITWTDKGSKSYAWAEDETGWDEDLQEEQGWVDTYAYASVYHSAYGAEGLASTDDSVLYEDVSAVADTNIMWASSEADAYRRGDFTANSAGWITISADHFLWQELSTENEGEWATGLAVAELYLMNEWDTYPTWDSAELYNEVFDGNSISDSATGTLTVSVWFNAGDGGWFDVGVGNKADVLIPEPMTVVLLGLGTLGLIRRRPVV